MTLTAQPVPDTAPAQPARSSSQRIVWLDGMRGMAALFVVYYHVWLMVGGPHLIVPVGPLHLNLLLPFTIGGVRVTLFLVLSGFLLYWPFARPRPDATPPTLAEFMSRRGRRLLPAYYAGLVFSLALPYLGYYLLQWSGYGNPGLVPAPDGESAGSIVSHVLLLHGLRPEWVQTINGPYWTLALEFQLYLAFPLLVWIARRRGIVTAVAVASAVTLAYRIWVQGVLSQITLYDQSGLYYFTLCGFFVGRWAEFALGMWAATRIAEQRVPSLPKTLLALVPMTAVGVWMTYRYGMIFAASDMLWGMIFVLLLFACHNSPALTRLLSWKPLAWVGTISYSLYLIHFPLLKAFHLVLRFVRMEEGLLAFGVVVVAGTPVLLLAAYGFYQLFERPFVNRRGQPSPGAPEPSRRGGWRRWVPRLRAPNV